MAQRTKAEVAAEQQGPAIRPLTKREMELLSVLLTNVKDKDQILNDPRLGIYPDIPGKYKHAPENKPYEYYRELLIERGNYLRVALGASFYRENKDILEQAGKKYGVDSFTITAILGIESSYCSGAGDYSALNVFVSHMLLFKDEDRKNYGLDQLKQFMVFCKKNNYDPYSVPSSYAGAIGYGQFIPSSLNGSFIDGDGDGVADPFSRADCIYSIANYLKKAGWGKSDESHYKAIYAYNHSDNYTKAMIELADLIRKDVQGRKGE